MGLKMEFYVPGDDFTRAGEASSGVKRRLKQLGIDPATIRRIAIAMYEGEINMVIHANGGDVCVEIMEDKIVAVLKDKGPGIPDIEKAMEKGFSTAPDNIRSLGFGAGMGLPNIKKYSDDLKLESEIGVGTTLTITVNTGGKEEKNG